MNFYSNKLFIILTISLSFSSVSYAAISVPLVNAIKRSDIAMVETLLKTESLTQNDHTFLIELAEDVIQQNYNNSINKTIMGVGIAMISALGAEKLLSSLNSITVRERLFNAGHFIVYAIKQEILKLNPAHLPAEFADMQTSELIQSITEPKLPKTTLWQALHNNFLITCAVTTSVILSVTYLAYFLQKRKNSAALQIKCLIKQSRNALA